MNPMLKTSARSADLTRRRPANFCRPEHIFRSFPASGRQQIKRDCREYIHFSLVPIQKLKFKQGSNLMLKIAIKPG